MSTPKYLTCPCGNTLSEKTDSSGHVYYCVRCGYKRVGRG